MPAGSAWRVLCPRSRTAGSSPVAATIARERKKICAQARDASNLRFCAEGKFDGIYLGSPSITT
jgi:hypothetical protein